MTLLPLQIHAINLDSLLGVYNNRQLTDSERMDALYKASFSIIYNNPDSAFLMADSLSIFAHKKAYTAYEARASMVKGAAYTIKGHFRGALDEQLKAADGFRAMGMTKALANTDNNIGMIYLNIGNYNDAIRFYKRATTIYRKLNPASLSLINTYQNLGIVYGKKMMLDSALFYFRNCLRLIQGHDQAERTIASIYSGIGQVWMDRMVKDSAVYYLEKSLAINRSLGDKIGISAGLSNLGEACLDDDPEKSIRLCSEGLRLAESVNSLKEIKFNCACLYLSWDSLHNATKALYYYRRYIKARDSLDNLMQSKALARKELAYFYNKKQMADSLRMAGERAAQALKMREKKLELSKTRQQFYYLMVLALLVAGFAVFAVHRLRVTREQKQLIEAQKKDVELGKILLEEKNEEVMDSIRYARRLQDAILPPEKVFTSAFSDAFIYYRPKDIVSGDFYWLHHMGDPDKQQYLLFAVADCTGHGVPGSMVSIVCHNALQRAVTEFNLTDPGAILDKCSALVIEQFAEGSKEVMDGMDISLAALELNNEEKSQEGKRMLKWAGANNPLWIANNDKSGNPVMNVLKPDKQPVGKSYKPRNFTTVECEVQTGDVLYLFSDGYPDQFGGPKGKKFKYQQFKELLLLNSNQALEAQCTALAQVFDDWKGDLEQIDDVCVLGVRL